MNYTSEYEMHSTSDYDLAAYDPATYTDDQHAVYLNDELPPAYCPSRPPVPVCICKNQTPKSHGPSVLLENVCTENIIQVGPIDHQTPTTGQSLSEGGEETTVTNNSTNLSSKVIRIRAFRISCLLIHILVGCFLLAAMFSSHQILHANLDYTVEFGLYSYCWTPKTSYTSAETSECVYFGSGKKFFETSLSSYWTAAFVILAICFGLSLIVSISLIRAFKCSKIITPYIMSIMIFQCILHMITLFLIPAGYGSPTLYYFCGGYSFYTGSCSTGTAFSLLIAGFFVEGVALFLALCTWNREKLNKSRPDPTVVS